MPKKQKMLAEIYLSGKWDLNPQPRVWGTRYLPIDILPHTRFKAGFVNRLYTHAIYINEGFVRFPGIPTAMERRRPGYAHFAPSHIVRETHC